jgi:hypothetical protein
MIRVFASFAALALLLSGCGGRVQLSPKAGKALPVKPEGAAVVPTPEALMTPPTQAVPKRSEEQLKRSEKRQEDKFDLPPPGQ